MQQTITLVLLGAYILLVSVIGSIHRRGDRGGSEAYFLASRKLSPTVLAITFIASWWGGGSAIGLADHAHANGINLCWIYGLIFSTYNLLIAVGVNLPTAWEVASVKQAMIGMSGSLLVFSISSLIFKEDPAQADRFIRQAGLRRWRPCDAPMT